MTHEELIESLKELKLKGILENFVPMAISAEKDGASFEKYLFMLVQSEISVRRAEKMKRYIKEAKIPVSKELEDYDFSRIRGITIRDINRLASGQFIKEATNIVLYGDFGLGKTHIASGLVQKMCEKGYKCLFTSTTSLVESMLEARKCLNLTLLWKKLDKFDLIACDELGYLPQSKDGAELFFQLISQRYERKSMLFTTNLTYSEWDKVFIDKLATAAAVDKIIHRCETFNIEGNSWRKYDAEKRAIARNNSILNQDSVVQN